MKLRPVILVHFRLQFSTATILPYAHRRRNRLRLQVEAHGGLYQRQGAQNPPLVWRESVRLNSGAHSADGEALCRWITAYRSSPQLIHSHATIPGSSIMNPSHRRHRMGSPPVIRLHSSHTLIYFVKSRHTIGRWSKHSGAPFLNRHEGVWIP